MRPLTVAVSTTAPILARRDPLSNAPPNIMVAPSSRADGGHRWRRPQSTSPQPRGEGVYRNRRRRPAEDA
jgi:hypothetical protein